MAPEILTELEHLNPKTEKGYRKQRHHQWLTDDIGHPKLREHLYALLGLMSAFKENEWDKFYELLERSFPKKIGQMKILFDDYELKDKPKRIKNKDVRRLSTFEKNLKKTLDYDPNKKNINRKVYFNKGVLEIPCQSDKIISRIDNGRTNRI